MAPTFTVISGSLRHIEVERSELTGYDGESMSHSVSAIHAGEVLTAAERSSGDSFLMSNIRRLGDIGVSTTRRGVCRQDTVSQYMFVSWLHGYMRRHGAYRCEERKNVGFYLLASVELYGKKTTQKSI